MTALRGEVLYTDRRCLGLKCLEDAYQTVLEEEIGQSFLRYVWQPAFR